MHIQPTIVLILWLAQGIAWARDPEAFTRSWTVQGAQREALIFPSSRSAKRQSPTVFVFHGHGGTAQNAARVFRIQEHWPDALVVYPQGLPTPIKLDPDGRFSGWQLRPGDQADRDLLFFDAILSTLVSDGLADPTRIFVTGHSNGGAFVYLLWSKRHANLTAIASCCGWSPGSLRDLQPLPAMHVAGEADPLVSFRVQSAVAAVSRAINGCTPRGEPWGESHATRALWFHSSIGSPIVFWTYKGGHPVPPEAPPAIVRFFKTISSTQAPKN